VERVNSLIADPNASAPDLPVSDANPMAGVLNGLGARGVGLNPAPPITNVVSEEVLNNTLAEFPGGAEAFWEGMQGTGIGREELLQMLASEMNMSSPVLQRLLISQGCFHTVWRSR
jgi:hypothetical protein